MKRYVAYAKNGSCIGDYRDKKRTVRHKILSSENLANFHYVKRVEDGKIFTLAEIYKW